MISTDAITRYARQLILPEIGTTGQEILLNSRVLCIGAGGLGSSAIPALAMAGIGIIGIMDDDTVALSNLHRQLIYTEQDMGKDKVTCVSNYINARNPDCTIHQYPHRFTPSHAAILEHYDIIVDGSDNFKTRIAIQQACIEHKKPLVSASVIQFQAQGIIFTPYLDNHPCYGCVFPDIKDDMEDNCASLGVLGAVVGIAGNWQALATIKHLLHLAPAQSKRFWQYDGLTGEMQTYSVEKKQQCALCSSV